MSIYNTSLDTKAEKVSKIVNITRILVHARGMSVKSVDNVYSKNVNVISAISVCKYEFLIF